MLRVQLYEVKVHAVETAEKQRRRLQTGKAYKASSSGAETQHWGMVLPHQFWGQRSGTDQNFHFIAVLNCFQRRCFRGPGAGVLGGPPVSRRLGAGGPMGLEGPGAPSGTRGGPGDSGPVSPGVTGGARCRAQGPGWP